VHRAYVQQPAGRIEEVNDAIKTWTTEAGLPGCIREGFAVYGRNLCGYVAVPETHPLFGNEDYDRFNVDCHGGLTFGRIRDGKHWVGFDTAHAGDGPDVQNESYVTKEVESLAAQLAEQCTPPLASGGRDDG
jgi:hypothetical protein